jgi:hypothetical protein
MAYKLYGRQVFEATVSNGEKYTFTCYGQGTSYGFRHICTLGYNNTTECKWIKKDIIARCSYYNRTWECFTYQTVLNAAINNLNVDEQTRQDLKTILIDRKELEVKKEVEEWTKDFENTWNSLSEKNKQHVRNGLGDNLIQTEEQAKGVLSVMKLMNAMDTLFNENKGE